MKTQQSRSHLAFTLVELIVAIAIIFVLAGVAVPAAVSAVRTSSLAVSASNIRQLAAGGAAYLGDNSYRFWPFLQKGSDGDTWWFGLEPASGKGKAEGEREIDMTKGPLANYLPRRMAPDPSMRFSGKPFKPKFKFGYIGSGYNVLLANGWVTGTSATAKKPLRYWDLKNPGQIVVFATSAQINTFQSPAGPGNPMIEEFYGIDDREKTVHFRHNGQAMVAYADGSAGFIPMTEGKVDSRAPGACIGTLDKKYLR
ncbi:MAG: prepilin-type N-terminal cleavage/methylation domain-containing protein [Chthoniobacterales bacterium]|nr:prepilin-type N-terminal cleavage/methylation domain-containing protein [Chthoniobacterales bacterium]